MWTALLALWALCVRKLVQGIRAINASLHHPRAWIIIPSLTFIITLALLSCGVPDIVITSDELLQWDQETPLDQPSYFMLPTHEAAMTGDIDLWKRSIEKGYKPSRPMKTWKWETELGGDTVFSPPHLAIINGKIDFLEWMESEYGPNVLEICTSRRQSTAWLAAQFGHFALVERLVASDCGGGIASLVKARFTLQRTIAHLAVLSGSLKLLQTVSSERPDLLRILDSHGLSPLGLAIESGQDVEMIKWFVTQAHRNAPYVKYNGQFGITLPAFAAYCGRRDVLQWIYEAKDCRDGHCLIDDGLIGRSTFGSILNTFGEDVYDAVTLGLSDLSEVQREDGIIDMLGDALGAIIDPIIEPLLPNDLHLTNEWTDWRTVEVGKFGPSYETHASDPSHHDPATLLYATNEIDAPFYFLAALTSDRPKLESLLQSSYEIDWSRVDAHGSTIVHYAAQAEDFEFFKWIVSVVPPLLLELPNYDGVVPVDIAAVTHRSKNLDHLFEAIVHSKCQLSAGRYYCKLEDLPHSEILCGMTYLKNNQFFTLVCETKPQ